MNIPNHKRVISELTLEELFPDTLTDVPCVNVFRGRDVWVATLMCAQYLESAIDSIVVRDDDFRPVGMVGGYDLLDHLRRNPTRDFQYKTTVQEIMLKDLPRIEKGTKFKDLMQKWQDSRRAFALIPDEFGDYSSIAARKMIEVGLRCRTDVSVASMPKKKIITFHRDDSLGNILDSMYAHKTRKLLLENSNQFISDRLILAEISRILHFQQDVDFFLDLPASQFKLGYAKQITKDLGFNELCSLMEKMEHPYVIYEDTAVTPWDVCLTLLSADVAEPLLAYREKSRCPTCGKEMD